MSYHQKFSSKAFIAVALFALLMLQVAPFANAAPFPNNSRKLTLVAHDATHGGSQADTAADHQFDFTIPSAATNLGSIVFEYCTLASGTPPLNTADCTKPTTTGAMTTAATLDVDEQGITGWTLHANEAVAAGEPGSDGSPYVSLASASTPAATTLRIRLDGIKNPTAENETFFVRIKTYDGIDPATSNVVDYGVVAASTATQIILNGHMPESLVFCAGATVDTVDHTTNGIPNCASVTTGAVSFTSLFSPTSTATATSQMSASTNAGSGYAISINGGVNALQNGIYHVNDMPAAAAAQIGLSQFGLNVKANLVQPSYAAFGAEVSQPTTSATKNGRAAANYNTANQFRYQDGEAIANSNSLGTDAQIFTVAYIVDVPGSLPAGDYQATLTFICTPTF
jgi:hypothetical protein